MARGEFKFDVDQTKYAYLDRLWPILEETPEGITLDDAVKRSHLDKNKMLGKIGELARDYTMVISKHLTRTNITSLVKRVVSGEKGLETDYEDALADSWIFDKFMLYNKIAELNCYDRVTDQREFDRLKEKWLVSKGR